MVHVPPLGHDLAGDASMRLGGAKSLLPCASSSLLRRIEAGFGIGIGNWRLRYQRPAPAAIFLQKAIYPPCSLRSSLPVGSVMSDRGTENNDAEQQPEQQQQQVEASESMPEAEELGDPPEKPLPGDCCGQGCATCVWDVYFEELAEYKKRQEMVKIQE